MQLNNIDIGEIGMMQKETAIIQIELAKLPLIPYEKKLRNKRDKTQKELLRIAHLKGDVCYINLNAGYLDPMPINDFKQWEKDLNILVSQKR